MTVETFLTVDAAEALDPPERQEARFAHFASARGSWVCLCGYRGVRRATRQEAEKAGYCVVCVDLYEALYGHPPWPERRNEEDVQLKLWPSEEDAKILALLADFFGS